MIQHKRRSIPDVLKNIPDYDSCGIYALVDENGKSYIGSSINVKKRLHFHRFHLSAVKCGRGDGYVNKKMQEAIQRGVIFEAVLLEKVADERLLWERERYYIDKFGGVENTYNELLIPRKFSKTV